MRDFDFLEEEKLKGTQDIRTFKKLLKYVKKPHLKIIFIVFILIIFTGVFDLTLPYLTKTAIDEYIVPPYVILNFKGNFDLEKKFLKEFKGEKIKIEEGKYIVKKRNLSSYELKFYEKKGILEKGLYLRIYEGKETFIKYEDIKNLPPSKILKIRKGDINAIKRIAIIYLLILFFLGIFTYLHMVLLEYTGQKIAIDIRMDLFSHILKLPVSFFDKNPTGRLVTRVTNDVGALNEFFTSVLIYFLKDAILIIGISIIILKINFQIGISILLLTPFIAIATEIFRKKVRDAYREVRRKLATLNAYTSETLSGINVIQIYNQEESSFKKFKDINEGLFKANMKQLFVFAIFRPIIDFIRAFAIAILIFLGGWGIIKGSFTLGSLAAFLYYLEMLFRPIMDLSEKYNILQSAMAGAERISLILDEKEEDKGKNKVLQRKGEIVFEDVWLKYDEGDWVLKGVSFKVSPHEKVAIVGPTGAGKTTLISAILKFYPVQKGRILVDGLDIREWDTYELRKRIALVLQDVFIFSGNFIENITLREENPSLEKVKESARRVYLDEFIERRKNNYFEEISERGKNLSQGEKELLSFARAIYFEPEILILDEPTSSVDSYTENLIQKGIKELLKNSTSLIIAHRLSTIKDCDKIIVLHKGKIVEMGKHEELLERKGLYSKLWELQVKEKELIFR
jgi:ABC-type multidrug transport system fused ATPase/permease subunit